MIALGMQLVMNLFKASEVLTPAGLSDPQYASVNFIAGGSTATCVGDHAKVMIAQPSAISCNFVTEQTIHFPVAQSVCLLTSVSRPGTKAVQTMTARQVVCEQSSCG